MICSHSISNLRDRSVIVRISNLPNDLTAGEAEKVSSVLGSLRGYLLALTNGNTDNDEPAKQQRGEST